uniref:N-acetyltransferase domain-containing protein n=1 Tax=Panagrolaimus sp. ES5 TaxID=591445 RepID=A0AC34FUJ2_9BILA
MVPTPSNPKLVGIQYFVNPDHDIWVETVHLIYENEKWFLSEDDYDTWIAAFGPDNFNLIVALDTDDYDTWIAAFGPDNFNLIVALDTGKNEVVGCISIARFEPEKPGADPIITVGMYFVKPSHRKIGLGKELWRRAFEDERFQRDNTGLISVEEMMEKYSKIHGFNQISETKIVACRGIVSDIHTRNLTASSLLRVIHFPHACAEYGLDAIAAFDASINGGLRRDHFLKAWLEAPNSLASHVAINHHQEIVGFISLRKSLSNDLSVAPLYAKTPDVASTLLRSAFECVDDLYQYRYIFFHPLTANSTARKLFVKLTVGTVIPITTLTPQFTSSIPNIQSENIFSVTDIGTCAFF